MGHTGDHYLEQIAADALEILWLCGALQEVAKLVVVDLRSGGIVQEPVSCTANSGNSDIGSNRHIPVKRNIGFESLLSYITTIGLTREINIPQHLEQPRAHLKKLNKIANERSLSLTLNGDGGIAGPKKILSMF